MAPLNKNTQVFLSLVRAGLWEQDVQLASFEQIDFNEVYRLAEEQSVVGLVAAGLEHVKDVKVPQEVALTFAGSTLQLELRNTNMNHFIEMIVDKMRESDIYTVLVKGQGLAQCYERPLWRACGDIDFFLSNSNYSKAKSFLLPFASYVDDEDIYRDHLSMSIGEWVVELHGTMRPCLWRRLDNVLDEVTKSIFYEGEVRSWLNGRAQVFLPAANIDVIIVFSHIVQHFYNEGIGLRQICDWCRLLCFFKDVINPAILNHNLKRAGILSEWMVFASLAVNYLGMPEGFFPLYDNSKKNKMKADKVMDFVLEVGNMGHNRDYSYYKKYPILIYKAISLWRHTIDALRIFPIFPFNSVKVWCNRLISGFINLFKGK